MQFLSIYLHIPFCQHRCSYCAFNIYTKALPLADDYIDAMCREITLLERQNRANREVHTVYLGGGTPSLLEIRHYERLFAALHKSFDILSNCEITFEINPADANPIYLESLYKLGVNRLSIGMQSAVASELHLFERDHTLADVDRTVALARAAGFDNLSFDLIYGVPNQTLGNWEATLNHALSYRPEHFSLYSLQLESGTKLTQQVKYGELSEPDDDLAADMYDLATEKLSTVGLVQYEISSWGKPSQHNLQYWRNLPYLGLGAGAHGYVENMRTVNVMRPEKYIQRLNEENPTPFIYPQTPATQSAETITREEAMFETIMLGLRMLTEGLSLAKFEARFGISLFALHGKTIARLKSQGLLREEADTLYLTQEARLIGNRVFGAFLPEETKSI